MRTSTLIFSAAALIIGAAVNGEQTITIPFSRSVEWKDLRPSKPLIQTPDEVASKYNCERIAGVVQAGTADWENVIGMVSEVSAEEACQIAENNPEIGFFFYMTGDQIAIQNGPGFKVFRKGDAVFFSGVPNWASAPDFGDGYVVKRFVCGAE